MAHKNEIDENDRDRGGRILPGKKWRVFNFVTEVAVESPGDVDEEEAAEDANEFINTIGRTRGRVHSSFCSITNTREFDPENDLPFIAGLVVGEGSFFFGVGKDKEAIKKGWTNPIKITPTFYIKMTDESTIRLVQIYFDKLGVKFHLLDRESNEDGWKKTYSLKTTGCTQVRKIVGLLLPYLWGDKKRAAEIMHEFIISRDRNKGKPYTELEISLVHKSRQMQGRSSKQKSIYEILDIEEPSIKAKPKKTAKKKSGKKSKARF